MDGGTREGAGAGAGAGVGAMAGLCTSYWDDGEAGVETGGRGLAREAGNTEV